MTHKVNGGALTKTPGELLVTKGETGQHRDSNNCYGALKMAPAAENNRPSSSSSLQCAAPPSGEERHYMYIQI